MLIAVITEWDRELTDKIFVSLKIFQAKKGKDLKRIDYIPDSGSGLSIFIENIEKFDKKDTMKKIFYTSRPKENTIFYTCKRLESVPDTLIRVTDFFFYPMLLNNNKLKVHIFRHGSWMDGQIDCLCRDYIKSYYFDFSKTKNWGQYLEENPVKIKNKIKA